MDFGIAVLRMISLEDLIVMEAFAGRSQNWADIEGILRLRGAALDRRYIRRHVGEFAALTEKPEMSRTLKRLHSEMAP